MDARVGNGGYHAAGIVLGTIVDDQHLKIGKGLAQNTVDGSREQVGAVIGRQNDANFGARGPDRIDFTAHFLIRRKI